MTELATTQSPGFSPAARAPPRPMLMMPEASAQAASISASSRA